jgi:arsenite methyltransferase
MLQFDEKQAKQVEQTYMTADIVEQRRATRALLALQPGERVLDIGSGPGFLAEEMAAEVGPEGAVHGVDPSESMLAIARRRGTAVQYALGDAVSLPFDDETFDAAIATQVYEYVPDMPAALAEVRRVLRPGGRLLLGYCAGEASPGLEPALAAGGFREIRTGGADKLAWTTAR